MEQFTEMATTAVANDDKAAKKEKVQAMRAAMQTTLAEDPEFAKKVCTRSNDLKVLKTLAYGVSGGLVVDEEKTTSDKRVLKATSKIHGYRIQNVSDTPIEYTTEVWTKDGDKFVGSTVVKVLQPGEVTDINRKYMTMLCAREEFSFTLANGTIIASSSTKKKSGKNIVDELASYYFKFSEEDGTKIGVNSDLVKLSIDDADGKVKPEFEATFGYLNNPKAKKAPKEKNSTTFTTQVYAANYINTLLKESQGM